MDANHSVSETIVFATQAICLHWRECTMVGKRVDGVGLGRTLRAGSGHWFAPILSEISRCR